VATWSHSAEAAFAADHPTAAGHFPGDPIIPGAVLLEEVLAALAPARGGAEIRWVKFLRPVRPGDRLLIRWEPQANGETRFEGVLRHPERLALTGLVRVADHG
jgi:3-hydroxymyristoyl/3-hydroxydecanoyl-(acyl carrier protein) dehydratase